MGLSNDKLDEIFRISQEEMAEVIVAISKVVRFGIDNAKPGTVYTNRMHLAEEIGDVMAMIDLMKDFGVVSEASINLAKAAKLEKLKAWSTIFND